MLIDKLSDEIFPERPANGTADLRFDPPNAILRVYGDGADVSRYLPDAYRYVQDKTGTSPMCFVSLFSDATGSGIEVLVTPSPEPAGGRIIG